MGKRPPGFVVTLQNERNTRMRDEAEWSELFHKGDLVISGCGFYAERDMVKGITYVNTSLGKPVNDTKPKVKFHANEPNYALLTIHSGKDDMTVELKTLDGKVLDRTEIAKRKN